MQQIYTRPTSCQRLKSQCQTHLFEEAFLLSGDAGHQVAEGTIQTAEVKERDEKEMRS